MHDITSLEQYNTELTSEIISLQEVIRKKRQQYGWTAKNEYVFTQLANNIQTMIDQFLGTNYSDVEQLPCLIHWIDKGMYGADLTIKFDTSIVRSLGKTFASELVPQVVNLLEINKNTLHIKTIEQKGIYINCILENNVRADIGEQILTLGDRYGDLDTYKGQAAIAEYSSPNAAKHLHAGHVRSTVIGYVLSNIYEHAGYTVYRRNHINDRGGFGQLIEGWKRWYNILFDQGLRNNDLNYQIYTIFRQAEKLTKTRQEEEATQLSKYFTMSTQETFLQDFTSFTSNSINNFHALEAGDAEMFTIRKNIVASSLTEFKEFYDKLDITHDYTIGESFYEKVGRQCIKMGENMNIIVDGIKRKAIVRFTQEYADQYLIDCTKDAQKNPERFAKGLSFLLNSEDYSQENPEIIKTLIEQKTKEINADIGSYVALLDNRERFVVLRSDGGSIYATRDLGCLRFRMQTFSPSLIMYEVGQEQADHFQKLFETADHLGWLENQKKNIWFTRLQKTINWIFNGKASKKTKTQCLHIAHGFYVDASTKKKLSSRAGASNVHTLIDATIAYFKDKYADSTEFTSEEIAHNARTLGVASIIINDLSKNRMDPVLVDEDLTKTIQGFEQSGGAYLIYTICRAKSLLKKATVERDHSFIQLNKNNSSTDVCLRTIQEITLLQQLSELPLLLEKSCLQHEPSVLVQYAYHLTQSFNTMYGATDRIIDNAVALRLTACYIQVMTNVLRMCNIEPLERM